jgi:hypothetical protein
MRLLRLRLRLRTLLIAVAVAGTALGGWTMWRRREYCLERTAYYDARFRLFAHMPDLSGGRVGAEYLERADAYRHVARYPWLPMPREPE